ncbi:glycosyltransferase [Dapis sp. BLCC M126]|uniref:glycosyltransferase n=1 Tax=Dapis sp. BLCC M126 TaxID=3400189 RepID=UPI003CEDDF35
MNSIVEQILTDFELIISDDYYTDNTPKIIWSYLEKDSRVKYLQNSQNLGLFLNWSCC